MAARFAIIPVALLAITAIASKIPGVSIPTDVWLYIIAAACILFGMMPIIAQTRNSAYQQVGGGLVVIGVILILISYFGYTDTS